MFSPGPEGEAACLMFLMPAVRVAWAEGRVTWRERAQFGQRLTGHNGATVRLA